MQQQLTNSLTAYSFKYSEARWANWGRWSACSSSCGEGVHTRIRACFRGDYGEGNCTGETFTTKECNVTCENGIPVLPGKTLSTRLSYL